MRYYRLKYDDATYHITTRCNNKELLFNKDIDFIHYLEILSRCKDKLYFLLYDYTIMHNHVHLLIKPTESANISRVMQAINRQYARWYNAYYKRNGHFWESRFDSVLITDDRQLLAVMRYIDYNTVRAGLCKNPVEWKYSGASFYLNGDQDPLVDIPDTYTALESTNELRRRAYASIFPAHIGNQIKVI